MALAVVLWQLLAVVRLPEKSGTPKVERAVAHGRLAALRRQAWLAGRRACGRNAVVMRPCEPSELAQRPLLVLQDYPGLCVVGCQHIGNLRADRARRGQHEMV